MWAAWTFMLVEKRSSQEARCGRDSSGFRGDLVVMALGMEMLRGCGWGPPALLCLGGLDDVFWALEQIDV